MTEKNKTLINISAKAFIQVIAILVFFLIATIILTYVIPSGTFGTLPDGSVDYSTFHLAGGRGGIPIWKGVLAPVLVFFSADGPKLIVLSLFLLIMTASFQVMTDAGGIKAMISAVADRLGGRRYLAISALSLLFMCFGAFFGLFEEMLTMLPIVAMFCLSIGFDSFTGFLVCTVSCGFGFASAITNPFTVLLACSIIGADPLEHVWYRVIIFIVMYLLLQGFIYLYIRKIDKDPEASCSLEHDREARDIMADEEQNLSGPIQEQTPEEKQKETRVRRVCTTFLLGSFIPIICGSLFSALTDYIVVMLTAYFLVFGILSGILCMGSLGKVMKSFLSGIKAVAPTIIIIALSASIKYVFEEGGVLPTIAYQINQMVVGKNLFAVTMIIFGIVLLLEFFISSSTAKAIFVMGILAVLNVGLSDQMSVLIYTFADGYTNLLFPTSPVLLIGLSMIGVDYMKWVKISIPLFLETFALEVGFLFIGIAIGY